MSEDRAMKAYGDIMDIALQLDRDHALAIRDAANAMKAEIAHGRERNAALGNAIELALFHLRRNDHVNPPDGERCSRVMIRQLADALTEDADGSWHYETVPVEEANGIRNLIRNNRTRYVARDAERYRWLRSQCSGMPPWSEADSAWGSPEDLDSAIDAEITPNA